MYKILKNNNTVVEPILLPFLCLSFPFSLFRVISMFFVLSAAPARCETAVCCCGSGSSWEVGLGWVVIRVSVRKLK